MKNELNKLKVFIFKGLNDFFRTLLILVGLSSEVIKSLDFVRNQDFFCVFL